MTGKSWLKYSGNTGAGDSVCIKEELTDGLDVVLKTKRGDIDTSGDFGLSYCNENTINWDVNDWKITLYERQDVKISFEHFKYKMPIWLWSREVGRAVDGEVWNENVGSI